MFTLLTNLGEADKTSRPEKSIIAVKLAFVFKFPE